MDHRDHEQDRQVALEVQPSRRNCSIIGLCPDCRCDEMGGESHAAGCAAAKIPPNLRGLTATRCAVCRRALTDAASVERGLGPDCARKYGVADQLDPDQRREANRAIHELALHASGVKGVDVGAALVRLSASGARVAAEACARFLTTVTIEEEGPNLYVRCAFVRGESVAWRTIGGRWDVGRKNWVVASSESGKRGVWNFLRHYHPGELGIGPRGPFVIPPLTDS